MPKKAIFQIKVTLKDISPPVWRRLLVAGNIKLDKFHLILQKTMNWQDYHLHQFCADNVFYSTPDEEWGGHDFLDERRFSLDKLLSEEKDTLTYEYDFGDGWIHKIVLEKIFPFDNNTKLPQCLGGKRAGPPEDVGGPWGYEEFLKALNDPEHPEHDDLLEWAGGEFDPEAFDPATINNRFKNRKS